MAGVTRDEIIGCILAGGTSRRLGGDDKALKPLAGRTLVARVIARLGPQVRRLFINANGDPARFSGTGLDVFADDLAGHQGPLAGVLTALDRAAEEGGTRLVTVSVDTPFLPLDLVERLAEAPKEAIAMACSSGGDHQVCALWPVALRAPLRRFLTEGRERRVAAFAAAWPVARIAFSDSVLPGAVDPVDPFLNLNTPEDFAAAERLLAAADPQWAE